MAKQPDHPSQPTPFRTTIGGQALIEGILMRGPEKQAIVVRKPDGDLVTKVEELHLIKERHPILGVPLIRGTVNFLDSMVKGVQALMFSAEFYPEDEEEAAAEPSKFEVWLEKKLGSFFTADLVNQFFRAACWASAFPCACSFSCPPSWADCFKR